MTSALTLFASVVAGIYEATRIWPTFEERMAIVDAMLEYKEYIRLRELQNASAKRQTI